MFIDKRRYQQLQKHHFVEQKIQQFLNDPQGFMIDNYFCPGTPISQPERDKVKELFNEEDEMEIWGSIFKYGFPSQFKIEKPFLELRDQDLIGLPQWAINRVKKIQKNLDGFV